MTLHPRWFEWIDWEIWFPEATALLDLEDIMSAWVAWIIMNWEKAPEIISLPDGVKPKIIWDFDTAAQFYDWDEPTYYMW